MSNFQEYVRENYDILLFNIINQCSEMHCYRVIYFIHEQYFIPCNNKLTSVNIKRVV